MTRPPLPEQSVPDSWQGSPRPSRWHAWPGWLLVTAGLTFVTAFLVGGFGGNDATDAANLAAVTLFLFAVAAFCVGLPAALYRRHRARRIAAEPQPGARPFAPCYRCGYPLAVHSGEAVRCPEAGTCYLCGQPFTTHVGYELTCPVPPSI